MRQTLTITTFNGQIWHQECYNKALHAQYSRTGPEVSPADATFWRRVRGMCPGCKGTTTRPSKLDNFRSDVVTYRSPQP